LPDGVDERQLDDRLGLLETLETNFHASRPDVTVESHRLAYDNAVRMMRSQAVGAFTLDEEDDALRDAYGRNSFGQGCLLARRLEVRGVPGVDVALGRAEGAGGTGWATHHGNFTGVKSACETLEPAWATLTSDLKQRGVDESPLVIWMEEFGRTPEIAADR